MLTKKQLDLLAFIREKISAEGVSPSYDEMKDALELKSKSGVHRLVCALEERGYVRRLPNRARALEVIRFPPQRRVRTWTGTPDVVSISRDLTSNYDNLASMTEIPVMGQIAAGSPIEAISFQESTISVPPSMLHGLGEHFALKVSGDSMIGAGINNGDTVVVRRQPTADSGDVIVALVRGLEATLKRLRIEGGRIYLDSANPEYDSMEYTASEIEVQGKLVCLLRTY